MEARLSPLCRFLPLGSRPAGSRRPEGRRLLLACFPTEKPASQGTFAAAAATHTEQSQSHSLGPFVCLEKGNAR